jgi:hypothetical protein
MEAIASGRKAVAAKWFDRIVRTYPPEAARFIAAEGDHFRNPVGHVFQEAVSILVQELLTGMDAGRVQAALESMMSIRAVQDFTPARAIGPIFDLREIVREESTGIPFEILCARIDQMALAAFDLYMKYREKTYEIRLNEARRRVGSLERVLASRGRQE